VKRLLIIKLLVLFLISASFANDIDVDKKLHEASLEDRYLMFFFHMPDCAYCERMMSDDFYEKVVMQLINKNMVFIEIYRPEKSKVTFKDFTGNHLEFARHVGVGIYPTTLFMESNGTIVHRAVGYRNADELNTEIKYVTTGSYKKMKLERFAEEMEFSDE
jgi:thioredoxin-related protein